MGSLGSSGSHQEREEEAEPAGFRSASCFNYRILPLTFSLAPSGTALFEMRIPLFYKV